MIVTTVKIKIYKFCDFFLNNKCERLIFCAIDIKKKKCQFWFVKNINSKKQKVSILTKRVKTLNMSVVITEMLGPIDK